MRVAEHPEFRIPTLEEVRAVPSNGLRVASTFSGAGGSTTGWRAAGYEVPWANEFVPEARDTYRANWPGTILDPRDVREVRPDEILEATGLAVGELDVLDGSPPCAGFSMAGRRERGWGKVRAYSGRAQRDDDLFLEFVRLLVGIRPRAFVAENVPGLARGTAFGFFRELLARLRAAGYRVDARLVDASRLGVPQSRVRLLFVGVRADLSGDPPFPRPLPWRYSIRDALPELAGARIVHVAGSTRGNSHDVGDPCPTVMAHGMANNRHSSVLVEPDASMRGYATGREWARLVPGSASTRYFQLVRPDPSMPCPTVTAAGGNPGLASVTHPTECRKFSIDELKRLCAFPPDYVLTGTYAQRWERLGRSVPPPVMAAVGVALLPILADGR